MQRSGVAHDPQCGGLFADKYVSQRSLPNRSHYSDTSLMRHTGAGFTHKGAPLPSSSTHHASDPGSLRGYPSSSGRSNAKPPLPSKRPSSSSCCKSSSNVSQLRRQSLPPGVSKSKSTSSTSAGVLGARGSSNPQSSRAAVARQSTSRLLCGPCLTGVRVRGGQQRWQQSIPSKSSPKQPLLEKRHAVIVSQKCVRRGSLQQMRSIYDSALHVDRDVHKESEAGSSRKASCSSDIEITRVQFDVERLPTVARRRSSFSTAGSFELEETTTSKSKPHRTSEGCQDRTLHKKRSIEVHVPSSSSCSDSSYKTRSHSDSSCQGVQSTKIAGTSKRSSLSEEGDRKHFSPCKRKGSTSMIKRNGSFDRTSDEGMLCYRHCDLYLCMGLQLSVDIALFNNVYYYYFYFLPMHF